MSYQDKIEAKRARYDALSEKAEKNCERAWESARKVLDGIPLGQPILVGHHSERRHRSDISRSDNLMRKSFEEQKKAEYYAQKAGGVGTGGISSDDEEAVEKLEAKIEKLEKQRETAKKVNLAYRCYLKSRDKTELESLGISDVDALEANVNKGYSWDRQPIPKFSLTNLGARIRQAKQRLEILKARPAEAKEEEVNGVKIVHNTEENRIQLLFPGKPDAEVRTKLKRLGFRWSPTNSAWQRHLNANGIYAAKEFVATL